MKKVFATLCAVLAVGVAAAAAFVWSGVYNIAASSPHTQFVYSMLENTMQRSVQLRASGIEAPPLSAPALFERGAMCYQDHCQQCHGGPGVAQNASALGMQPAPGPLMDATSRWKIRELYWITRNGITMSGMPAWRFRLADADLWALVGFIDGLPQLSPPEYRELMARLAGQQCGLNTDLAVDVAGDLVRGRLALTQYACHGCHEIPGITGSAVQVGPPLAGTARRQLIAGQVGNTPDQMVRWLRNPQSIDPMTAMPNLGVSERDARDMAAYLATLW